MLRYPGLPFPGFAAAGKARKAAISRRAGRHDGTVADDGGTGWAGYYARSVGRAPRPLRLAACREPGAGQDRMAIDPGCGEGTDALELPARGWLVLAVGAEPAGLALLRAPIPAPAAGPAAGSGRRTLAAAVPRACAASGISWRAAGINARPIAGSALAPDWSRDERKGSAG